MSAHSFSEHEQMLRSFRCQDLANLLAYAGQSKNGKKSELLDRCLSILRKGNANIQLKIKDIYNVKVASIGVNYNSLSSAVNSNNNSGSNSPDPSSMMMNGRYQPTGLPQNYNNAAYISHLANQHMGHHMQATGYPLNHVANGRNMFPQQQIPPIRVQFEKLAFYEFLHELHIPIKLLGNGSSHNSRQHCLAFNFIMNLDQANEISAARELKDGKVEFSKQIHLRFGYYDREIQADQLPANLVVNVNSKTATLPAPKPTSKPNADIIRPGRSIDVTAICKLASNMHNKIEIMWTNPSEGSNANQPKLYCLGVYMFKKLSVQFLTKKLNTRLLNADVTRQMVREKLQITDSDFEIETNELKVSLMCPLMKFRMNMPGRSTGCKHVQCFDLESYLMMNEKKPTWNCPVCDKKAPFDELVIDSLNRDIIKETSGMDCEEVVFAADGSWKRVCANDVNGEAKEKESNKAMSEVEECVELICDDSLTSDIEQESPTVVQPKPSSPVPPAATSAPAAPKPNMCVIDLTIDSSDDEDPPTTSTAQTVESVRPQNTLGLDNLVIKKQVSLPTEENSTPQHQSNSTTADSIFNQVPSNNSTNMRSSEPASSLNNSIISISSSNDSNVGNSRSTTPVPQQQQVSQTRTPDSHKNNSDNNNNRSPAQQQERPNNGSLAPRINSPTKQPQRTSDSPHMAGDANRQNTPNKHLAPSTLSNSQLARGLSIGASSSSTSTTNATNIRQSPNEIPVQPVSNKPRYMNSFAGTKSSVQTNSLTSVSSSIENTHLNSPGSSSSPKLPMSNQQQRQQHLSSRTHEQLVNSSISPNSPSRQHPANIQVERALQHQKQQQQQQRSPSRTNQPQQHQMSRQAAGDHRPGVYHNRPTMPNSNQRLESSLVGVNNRISKQSRPDSSASQVTRDKAMMALRDELKTNASRQHQQVPMNRNGPSSKNITPQNINYNLKETLNHSRVGTAIKRTSFDSDLPNNSANKKPNTSHGSTNMHRQQMMRDPRQVSPSMANRGHAPSSSGQMRHQQPGGSSSHPSHHYPHGHPKSATSNGNGGSSSEAPFFINKLNSGAGSSYSESRGGGGGGLQSYANHGYHQQHMQQQQKMSASGNHHSPNSPPVRINPNILNPSRFNDRPSNPSYNSNMPAQYQYHTQHLQNSPKH